jgi:hypothetical protein
MEKRKLKSPKLRNRFSSLQNNVSVSVFNNLSGVYSQVSSNTNSHRRLPSITQSHSEKKSLKFPEEFSRRDSFTGKQLSLPDYVSLPVARKASPSAELQLDTVNSTLSHAMVNFVQRAV